VIDAPPLLCYWGDTQVGKTTLLVTATHGPARVRGVDYSASAEALAAHLRPHFDRLRTGRWVQPTSERAIDIGLRLTSGGALRVRDVMGGITRQLSEPWVRELLVEASAFLFLVEWEAADLDRQLACIEAARNFWGDAPRALVFTKCERALSEDDPAWERRPGWWRGRRWLAGYEPLLASFGGSVWPSSAYGYAASTGLPACVIGEFGQLIPYRIQPRGVAAPFAHVLRGLGLAR